MNRYIYEEDLNQRESMEKYRFEIELLEFIKNGSSQEALELYEDFFSCSYSFNPLKKDDLEELKYYLNSINHLIFHRVVSQGVAIYTARNTYDTYLEKLRLAEDSRTILNYGRDFIKCYSTKVERGMKDVHNVFVRKAIEYINNNLEKDLSLKDLSDYLGINKCYFCTEFKKATNMSFTEYINLRRIEKSKYLLANSKMSILDIAVAVGYNSQSYFATLFKKYNNISPKEFRDNSVAKTYIFA